MIKKPARIILIGEKDIAAEHVGAGKRALTTLHRIQESNPAQQTLRYRCEDGSEVKVHTKIAELDVIEIVASRKNVEVKRSIEWTEMVPDLFPVPIIDLVESESADYSKYFGYIAKNFFGFRKEVVPEREDANGNMRYTYPKTTVIDEYMHQQEVEFVELEPVGEHWVIDYDWDGPYDQEWNMSPPYSYVNPWPSCSSTSEEATPGGCPVCDSMGLTTCTCQYGTCCKCENCRPTVACWACYGYEKSWAPYRLPADFSILGAEKPKSGISDLQYQNKGGGVQVGGSWPQSTGGEAFQYLGDISGDSATIAFDYSFIGCARGDLATACRPDSEEVDEVDSVLLPRLGISCSGSYAASVTGSFYSNTTSTVSGYGVHKTAEEFEQGSGVVSVDCMEAFGATYTATHTIVGGVLDVLDSAGWNGHYIYAYTYTDRTASETAIGRAFQDSDMYCWGVQSVGCGETTITSSPYLSMVPIITGTHWVNYPSVTISVMVATDVGEWEIQKTTVPDSGCRYVNSEVEIFNFNGNPVYAFNIITGMPDCDEAEDHLFHYGFIYNGELHRIKFVGTYIRNYNVRHRLKDGEYTAPDGTVSTISFPEDWAYAGYEYSYPRVGFYRIMDKYAKTLEAF